MALMALTAALTVAPTPGLPTITVYDVSTCRRDDAFAACDVTPASHLIAQGAHAGSGSWSPTPGRCPPSSSGCPQPPAAPSSLHSEGVLRFFGRAHGGAPTAAGSPPPADGDDGGRTSAGASTVAEDSPHNIMRAVGLSRDDCDGVLFAGNSAAPAHPSITSSLVDSRLRAAAAAPADSCEGSAHASAAETAPAEPCTVVHGLAVDVGMAAAALDEPAAVAEATASVDMVAAAGVLAAPATPPHGCLAPIPAAARIPLTVAHFVACAGRLGVRHLEHLAEAVEDAASFGSVRSGSFATVYPACLTVGGRRCPAAVKIGLPSRGTSRLTVTQTQVRELLALQACAGLPGVMQCYGYTILRGRRGEQLALLLELCEGGSLTEVAGASASHAVPLSRRLAWAVEIAHGLAGMHARGVIHGDVKPDNVMLRGDGSVAIIDLGMAHSAVSDEDIEMVDEDILSSLAIPQGSLITLDPLVVAGRARLSPASDVYSLSITLWELLTQRVPYDRTGRPWKVDEFSRAITGGLRPDTTGILAGLHPALGDVNRCINTIWKAASQHERPSAAAVCDVLLAALHCMAPAAAAALGARLDLVRARPMDLVDEDEDEVMALVNVPRSHLPLAASAGAGASGSADYCARFLSEDDPCNTGA